MLIPTLVTDTATLAVPDTSYWVETAAHYYINAPGINTAEACVWGTSAYPMGNWSPYVAGANTVANGETFVKLGWNPIYLQPTTPFRNVMPNFGVEITCDSPGCNGLPCKIDPAVHGVNEMSGGSADGAGGASFCVVTVPSGQKANIVISGGSGSPSSDADSTLGSPDLSSSSRSSTSTTTAAAASSSSTKSVSTQSTNLDSPVTSFSAPIMSSPTPGASSWAYSYSPHVMFQSQSSTSGTSPTSANTASVPAATTSKQGAASLTGISFMSLLASFLIVSILTQFA